MSDTSRKYWAFISYSHQDEQWASWLHQALETYKLPGGLVGRDIKNSVEKIPQRLFPIFRDRDELAGASDLGSKLRDSLERSRTLIVVCSPRSAKSKWCNEEVRSFKALGRADRVFSLIVDGRPKSSLKTSDDENECFTPALLYQVDDAGNLTNLEASPLASDVRPGKEPRNLALLKLIAGILQVDFDDLRQRDLVRQRRERLRRQIMSCVAVFLLFVCYVLLADLGVAVPGKKSIQTMLDRNDFSVMRPVPAMSKVRDLAANQRRLLLKAYAENVESSGCFYRSFDKSVDPPDKPRLRDICSHSQSVFAVLSSPEQDKIIPVRWDHLQVPFIESVIDEGVVKAKYDYINPPLTNNYDPPESTWGLWYLSAAAKAIQQGKLAADEQQQLLDQVRDIQAGFSRFYNGAEAKGGWCMFPNQKDPMPNAYSTVLALQALLELRKANIGWEKSDSLRDRMLQNQVDWLIEHFHQSPTQIGWLGTGENALEVMDGLTLQIYGILLSAQKEAAIELPEKILQQIPLHLIDCLERTQNYTVQSGEFEAMVEWNGTTKRCKEAYRFLWFPWAVVLSERWLDYAKDHPQPRELVVQVQRVQGHLVTELGPLMVKDAMNNWTFIVAETLLGLSEVAVKK